MEVLHEVCCGLDVHKRSVTACLRARATERSRKAEVRTFGTTTGELLRLSEWLSAEGCTHVAMESTGVYWRPVWNLLEGNFALLLVNARHIKMVPGRKTDVKDSEWIAQLLELGLLRSSFVPDAGMRELRELTRSRKILVEERARQANRVQKVLETANIKLANVATDVLGVSGRAILEALIQGERDHEKLADLAVSGLRKKREQLREALRGCFTEHHAFMLRQLLWHVDFLSEQLAHYDQRIEEKMRPFALEIERLDTIPGIARRTAESIAAELGCDMTRFPTAAHAAACTGICPGNNESAGKRRSGATPKGNRWLRTALVEAAQGAVRKKGSYFQAQHRHIARRRGHKRAIVAVAHSLLVTAFHLLRRRTEYHDLGPRHFDQLQHEHLKRPPRPTARRSRLRRRAPTQGGSRLIRNTFGGSVFEGNFVPDFGRGSCRIGSRSPEAVTTWWREGS